MQQTNNNEGMYQTYFKNRSVIGGFLGDRSRRSKRATSLFIFFVSLIVVTIASFIFLFFQLGEYKYYLNNNTTPIGTSLEFARSGAKVEVTDVWTDQQRDVTTVRLRYDKNARNVLPRNGKDYNIYLASKQRDKPSNIEIEYGLLSVNGDGFLFIKGKLPQKAYQIFIANQLNLLNPNSIENPEVDTNLLQTDDRSIVDSLSRYSMNSVDNKGVLFFKDKSVSSAADNINFRINPYSESTNVYQGSFLTKKGEIDYKKIVSVTSTKSVIAKLQSQINESNKTLEQIEATKKEYEHRIKEAPDDTTSLSNIKQLDSKKEDILEVISNAKKSLEVYQKAEFNKEAFGNMNEKYKFLPLDSN